MKRITVCTLALVMVLGVASIAFSGGPIPFSAPVTVINTKDHPVPVIFPVRTSVSDGVFFDLSQDQTASLIIPPGVVMTSGHLSSSNGGTGAFRIFIGGKDFVYQMVNDKSFHAGIDLADGILSNGDLVVQANCYNIAGNTCTGAIMWSGYQKP